jgi:hypothetical protein
LNRDLHASFKLSSSGDTIALFAPDGASVDIVEFGVQQQDASEGRFPDGSGIIAPMSAPTPNHSNLYFPPNSPPELDSMPSRLVMRGQALQFTVNARDRDYPPQRLAFALLEGSPAAAGINPVSGLFSWTPSGADADGVYGFGVTVTDDGVPPLTTTNRFKVAMISKPELGAPFVDGGQLKLALSTVVGVRYQIEYVENLSNDSWKPYGSSFVASGGSVTIVHDLTREASVFYRLRVDAD